MSLTGDEMKNGDSKNSSGPSQSLPQLQCLFNPKPCTPAIENRYEGVERETDLDPTAAGRIRQTGTPGAKSRADQRAVDYQASDGRPRVRPLFVGCFLYRFPLTLNTFAFPRLHANSTLIKDKDRVRLIHAFG